MSGDLVALEAGGLQVVFSRKTDRYRHSVIEIGERGGPLLASCEGAGEEAWPPSPPLQELHVERRGESTRVALLVGRAGRSHWSLSVEVDPVGDTILFDVACRCSAPAGWLGSSYDLPGFEPSAAGGDAAAIVWPSGYELQVLGGEASIGDAGTGSLRIAACGNGSLARQTVRWRYRMGQSPRSR